MDEIYIKSRCFMCDKPFIAMSHYDNYILCETCFDSLGINYLYDPTQLPEQDRNLKNDDLPRRGRDRAPYPFLD
jgi:hypothetical protein